MPFESFRCLIIFMVLACKDVKCENSNNRILFSIFYAIYKVLGEAQKSRNLDDPNGIL